MKIPPMGPCAAVGAVREAGGGQIGSGHGWVVVAIGFLSMALVFGSRFSLGLFMPYFPEAFNTTAGAVSGALALSMLGAALAQPLIGILLDLWGGRVVLALGLCFAGVALVGTAFSSALWQVMLLTGMASSIAYASVSPVTITSIVSSWFVERRGTALGVATSGTKVAMIVLPPAVVAFIALLEWRMAMLTLGVLVWLLIPLVILFVRPAPGLSAPSATQGKPAGSSSDDISAAPAPPEADAAGPPRAADITLLSALKMPAFWLIAVSMFANGFIINLVFIHLPSYLLSQGYGEAFAAAGLAVLGAIGIAGNVLTGALSDRLGRRLVLSILFATRGLTTLLLVLLPGEISLIVFVLVFGLMGYGAIGVIGALTSDIFGPKSMGAILGSAYVFNQVGAAAGICAGGVSVELAGDYSAALWMAVLTSALSFACIAMLSFFTEKFSVDRCIH